MTQQELAEKLLFPLFRSIDKAYKEHYKLDIWEQFENALRASAYTSRMPVFYENVCRRLPIGSVDTDNLISINEAVNCGDDKTLLTWLRKETTYLTLLTRLQNETRKQDYKERTEQAIEKEESVDSLSAPDDLSDVL